MYVDQRGICVIEICHVHGRVPSSVECMCMYHGNDLLQPRAPLPNVTDALLPLMEALMASPSYIVACSPSSVLRFPTSFLLCRSTSLWQT